jgi:hypothetical protein
MMAAMEAMVEFLLRGFSVACDFRLRKTFDDSFRVSPLMEPMDELSTLRE